MDVTLINPFLDAIAEIFPQIGFQALEKKSVSLKQAVVTNPGVTIDIGVTGPYQGTVLIRMGTEEAKKFASTMMMGMQVTELNSIAQSAISEMGNMVCANACTRFSKAGISGLNISPPVLLIGEGSQVSMSIPKAVDIEFSVDGIPVDVCVGLC